MLVGRIRVSVAQARQLGVTKQTKPFVSPKCLGTRTSNSPDSQSEIVLALLMGWFVFNDVLACFLLSQNMCVFGYCSCGEFLNICW